MSKEYKDQYSLAEDILKILKQSDIESAKLVGSLASNNRDVLSDIDVELYDPTRSPISSIKLALNLIEDNFSVLFYDWAKSLLPDKFVLSVFLKQDNIFWYIDLSCYKDKKYPDIRRSDISQDRVNHIFKLWICNAKEELRGSRDKNNIGTLYGKLFKDESIISNKEKFLIIYKWLCSNSQNEYLLDKCKVIMEEINENSRETK